MTTFYIEQWKDKNGNYHFTKPSPNFNRALANTKYGFKTIALFRITLKPSVVVAHYDKDLSATIIEKA